MATMQESPEKRSPGKFSFSFRIASWAGLASSSGAAPALPKPSDLQPSERPTNAQSVTLGRGALDGPGIARQSDSVYLHTDVKQRRPQGNLAPIPSLIPMEDVSAVLGSGAGRLTAGDFTSARAPAGSSAAGTSRGVDSATMGRRGQALTGSGITGMRPGPGGNDPSSRGGTNMHPLLRRRANEPSIYGPQDSIVGTSPSFVGRAGSRVVPRAQSGVNVGMGGFSSNAFVVEVPKDGGVPFHSIITGLQHQLKRASLQAANTAAQDPSPSSTATAPTSGLPYTPSIGRHDDGASTEITPAAPGSTRAAAAAAAAPAPAAKQEPLLTRSRKKLLILGKHHSGGALLESLVRRIPLFGMSFRARSTQDRTPGSDASSAAVAIEVVPIPTSSGGGGPVPPVPPPASPTVVPTVSAGWNNRRVSQQMQMRPSGVFGGQPGTINENAPSKASLQGALDKALRPNATHIQPIEIKRSPGMSQIQGVRPRNSSPVTRSVVAGESSRSILQASRGSAAPMESGIVSGPLGTGSLVVSDPDSKAPLSQGSGATARPRPSRIDPAPSQGSPAPDLDGAGAALSPVSSPVGSAAPRAGQISRLRPAEDRRSSRLGSSNLGWGDRSSQVQVPAQPQLGPSGLGVAPPSAIDIVIAGPSLSPSIVDRTPREETGRPGTGAGVGTGAGHGRGHLLPASSLGLASSSAASELMDSAFGTPQPPPYSLPSPGAGAATPGGKTGLVEGYIAEGEAEGLGSTSAASGGALADKVGSEAGESPDASDMRKARSDGRSIGPGSRGSKSSTARPLSQGSPGDSPGCGGCLAWLGPASKPRARPAAIHPMAVPASPEKATAVVGSK